VYGLLAVKPVPETVTVLSTGPDGGDTVTPAASTGMVISNWARMTAIRGPNIFLPFIVKTAFYLYFTAIKSLVNY
jgi:hypothetical protein